MLGSAPFLFEPRIILFMSDRTPLGEKSPFHHCSLWVRHGPCLPRWRVFSQIVLALLCTAYSGLRTMVSGFFTLVSVLTN